MPQKPYMVAVEDVRVPVEGGGAETAFVMEEMFVDWSWGPVTSDLASPGTDEMNYVLEGDGRWLVDGEELDVTQGQVLYIPATAARQRLGGEARILRVSAGLPWDRVDLAEHQIRNEYRDWPSINS